MQSSSRGARSRMDLRVPFVWAARGRITFSRRGLRPLRQAKVARAFRLRAVLRPERRRCAETDVTRLARTCSTFRLRCPAPEPRVSRPFLNRDHQEMKTPEPRASWGA